MLTDLQIKIGRDYPHENCLWVDTNSEKPILRYYNPRNDKWDPLLGVDSGALESILKYKADLDDNGKILISQLPDTIINNNGLIYQGTWDPITNVPKLINGDTLLHGYYYIAINNGTNLGYEFNPGDMVLNDNGKWIKVGSSQNNGCNCLGNLYYTGEPSTVVCGGVPLGTKFENTPITEIIDMMLHGTSTPPVEPDEPDEPEYVPFSATLSSSVESDSYFTPGDTMSLVVSIVKGSADISKVIIDGNEIDPNSDLTIVTDIIPGKVYSATVIDSTGMTKDLSLSLNLYYKCYAGITDEFPESEGLNDATLTDKIKTTEYILKGSADEQYYWLALPSNITVIKLTDVNEIFPYGIQRIKELEVDGLTYVVYSGQIQDLPTTQNDNYYFHFFLDKSAKI